MDRDFEAWVESVLPAPESDEGGDVGHQPNGTMDFLREIFDKHGPVSSEEAARIGRVHQLALAREAVARVAHDIQVTTTVEPPPFEYREEEGGAIRLAFWGRYATTPIYGLTQAQVTVEVADFMQDEVVDDLHGVWPECSQHQRGLHPTLSSDRAEWVCRAGAHAVADIGQLPGQPG